MDKKKRVLSTVALFMIMFMMAVTENIKGVLIPQIKDYFQINATQVSLILTVSSIAYVVSTYFASDVAEKFGRRLTESFSILLVILGCVIVALSHTFPILLLGMIFINIGLGGNGVIINVVVPLLFVSYQSVIMNGVHFMYGLGATVGQRIVGYLVTVGWDFQRVYLYLVVFLTIFLVISHFIYYPSEKNTKETEFIAKVNPYKDEFYWLFVIAMALYIFAEAGLGNWLVDYLKVTQNMSENIGSQFISLFFLLLAIGRLLGGFIVDKLGKLRTIIVCQLVGSVCVLMGILLGGNGFYLISLAGLFYSIVFPTSVLMISTVYGANTTFMTSKILTFTFAGNMILNQLVGIVTDWLGFNVSIYMMPIAGILALMIYGQLYLKLKVKQIIL